MATIFFVFLGLIIGGLLAEEEGVVVGLFIGLAFGMIATLKGRIFQLDQDLSRTIKLLNNARSGQDDAAQSQEFESEEIVDTRLFSVQFSAVTPARFSPSIDDTPIPLNPASTTSRGEEGSNKTLTNWHNASSQQSTQKRTNEPDFAQKVFFAVRDFFTTSNIVVKVGAIILFFGVAFLLKYAADRSLFPIEMRLMAAIMSFAWINIIVARSVHVFGHVFYSDYAMLHSSLYQAATSIVWSVIAMTLMLVAYRKSSRYFWFAGAGLLALVVVKLFFVDLADNGSISPIVSFLAVGGLMLVIGYLSPLPPKIKKQNY